MNVIPFVHEGLGNSSYLVQISGDGALLVDPDRSVGRYLREMESRGLRLAGVLETHLHADFATGSRELLSLTGVEPHAPAAGDVLFPHRGVSAGNEFVIEDTRVRIVGSAGHTPEHVAYVIEAPRGQTPLLFSGGSLIVGGAARTDLVSPDLTEQLTRDQYRTLKGAFSALPDETLLYPTHGGGSFCSTGSGAERTSTLGRERTTNPLLQFEDEDEFTAWFPTTFPAVPDYFFRMRAINRSGPRLRREISDPRPLSPDEFHAASSSALVVDVRQIHEYHAAHVPGSLSIAFRPSYATWLGWLVDPGTPLLFVLGGEPLDEVIAESLLVGHEDFAGWLRGGIDAWQSAGLPVKSTRSISATEAGRMLREGAAALDVRETSEFAGERIDGAISIPLGSLPKALDAVPRGEAVIAYCGHGERSTTGISLLERGGIDAVNLEGGVDAWTERKQGAGR